MITQKNLSLLANRLAVDGKRMQESVMERDYCVSWFLAGLDNCPLRDKIAFKGATALKKCYFPDFRYSEDLNFSLTADIQFEEIKAGFDPAFEYILKASGINMSLRRLDKDSNPNTYTLYVSYDGPIPKNKPKDLKLEITIKEELVSPIAEKPLRS